MKTVEELYEAARKKLNNAHIFPWSKMRSGRAIIEGTVAEARAECAGESAALIRQLRSETKLREHLEAELAKLRGERRWVPVGERRPPDEDTTPKQVLQEGRFLRTASHFPYPAENAAKSNWFDARGHVPVESVTHWREIGPLPDKPA